MPDLTPEEMETRPVMLDYKMQLDVGQLLVSVPSRVTADDYQDIKELMDILLRRIARSVIPTFLSMKDNDNA